MAKDSNISVRLCCFIILLYNKLEKIAIKSYLNFGRFIIEVTEIDWKMYFFGSTIKGAIKVQGSYDILILKLLFYYYRFKSIPGELSFISTLFRSKYKRMKLECDVFADPLFWQKCNIR